MKLTAKQKHYVVLLAIGLACGLFSAWLSQPTSPSGLLGEWLQRAELVAYDKRVAFSATQQPSDEIAIVVMDEESFGVLPVWPWPRSFHAKVIRNLKKAGARLIGVDIIFAGVSNPDGVSLEGDLMDEPEPGPEDLEAAGIDCGDVDAADGGVSDEYACLRGGCPRGAGTATS